MNQLKFELSVLFTKTELSPFTENGGIRSGYRKMFGKEVSDADLERVVGEIIDDQVTMYNDFVQEIPDDYELE